MWFVFAMFKKGFIGTIRWLKNETGTTSAFHRNAA